MQAVAGGHPLNSRFMIISNNQAIADILKAIDEGRIQLPDFQRGWVWEDQRIRALIASISNGYPIGAAMFLQTGGDNVHFKARLFEGVDRSKEGVAADTLVLDGQQRNTSIYRSLYSKSPVETTDSKKKPIKRFYYINIPRALDTLTDRVDAIVSVPETRIVTRDIGRTVVLDLSSPEKEYEQHYFPLNLIFDNVGMMQWQMQYAMYHRNDAAIFNRWTQFFNTIVAPMSQYQIPVIMIGNDVPKEAVCQVFENVNQGGVSLTVFELVTATFAADNFELRKDWDRIWASLRTNQLLNYRGQRPFEGTDFLTAITLLTNYLNKTNSADGRGISCKKKDVLRLEYADYAANRDRLLSGLAEAVKFLNEQCVYTAIDIPYTSQLIPLSVLFAIDKNLWFAAHNRRKLERWYWCGVFGELYGSANEGRYVNDVIGMMEWIADDDALPDTVVRSNFHASRLQQLYTRNSAAYKGVMALILKAGARDFLKGTDMSLATYTLEYTDIHHIFPQSYCEKEGIDRARWNSVINKTPIYARTNRIIGGNAPSQYLSSLERNHHADPAQLDASLASHQIDVAAIRADDFDTYFAERQQALLRLIAEATGKAVSGREDRQEELSLFDRTEMETTED